MELLTPPPPPPAAAAAPSAAAPSAADDANGWHDVTPRGRESAADWGSMASLSIASVSLWTLTSSRSSRVSERSLSLDERCRNFSVRAARCETEQRRQLLLSCIESGFGDHRAFERIIRGVFESLLPAGEGGRVSVNLSERSIERSLSSGRGR